MDLSLKNFGPDVDTLNAPSVRPAFVDAMEGEIKANEPRKGNWNEYVPGQNYIADWLTEHTEKLLAAVRSHDARAVTEYCADVANIAMKIEEHYGASEIRCDTCAKDGKHNCAGCEGYSGHVLDADLVARGRKAVGRAIFDHETKEA